MTEIGSTGIETPLIQPAAYRTAPVSKTATADPDAGRASSKWAGSGTIYTPDDMENTYNWPEVWNLKTVEHSTPVKIPDGTLITIEAAGSRPTENIFGIGAVVVTLP